MGRIGGIGFVIALALAATVTAQVAEPVADGDPGADRFRAAESAPLSSVEVSEALIAKLLEQYPPPAADEAISDARARLLTAEKHLRDRESWRAQTEQLRERVDSADARQAAIAEQLNQLDSAPLPTVPEGLEAVEKAANELKEARKDTADDLVAVNSAISGGPEKRLADAERLNALKAQLRAADQRPAATEVERIARQAEIEAIQAEAAYLTLDLRSADRIRELQAARRNLLQAELGRMDAFLARLASTLEALRQADMDAREAKAREALRNAALGRPELQALAATVQSRVDEYSAALERRADVQRKFDQYKADSENVETLLDTLKKRLTISGGSATVGVLIQRELTRLPDPHELERTRRRVKAEIRTIQTTLLERELELAANPLEQFPGLADVLVDAPEDSLEQRVERDTLTDLLTERKKILNDLINEYSRFFELLVSVDGAIEEALVDIEAFKAFAVANSLWIPNRKVLTPNEFALLPQFASSMVNYLYNVGNEAARDSTWRIVSSLIIASVLVIFAIWADRRLGGFRAARLSELRVHTLLIPLAFELYVALLPVVFSLQFSWILSAPNIDNPLAGPVQAMVMRMAESTVFLVLVYRICQPGNLGRLQFGWSAQKCATIRSAFSRFLLPAYIVIFFGGILYRIETEMTAARGSRYLYLIGMVLCGFALRRVFHPERGVIAGHGLIRMLKSASVRWLFCWTLIGWVSFLGVLVVMGYMMAVTVFFAHTIETLWLVAVVTILGAALMRYMRAERLRALRLWREERKDSRAYRLTGEVGAWRQNRDQGRDMWRLLAIGSFLLIFSFTWADTLPAFGSFAKRPLLESGSDVLLTYGQAIRMLICVVVTVVLSIHLPRIMQILILSRLTGVSRGARYAFSTLLSYFVIMGGIFALAIIAEIKWANVQWLFAAATVGLSFGLQEIVGNLVAGIMILFERPIRVGDVVTVNATTGVVTRIRIRSTTIRQWDRTELIVPNKDIITNQVVNWSLSDAVTRLSIELKVGFDKDPETITELLGKVLRSVPKVSHEPAPRALVVGVDDYAYRIVCHAFLDNLENRLTVQDMALKAIIRAFEENGIDIPCPRENITFSGIEDIHMKWNQTAAGEGTGGNQPDQQDEHSK